MLCVQHIDCAEYYHNEHEVGAALQAVLAEGMVRREEVFLTSKLWNSDHAAAAVEPALRKSLTALSVSYLDLYLIHWPVTHLKGPVVKPSIKVPHAAVM